MCLLKIKSVFGFNFDKLRHRSADAATVPSSQANGMGLSPLRSIRTERSGPSALGMRDVSGTYGSFVCGNLAEQERIPKPINRLRGRRYAHNETHFNFNLCILNIVLFLFSRYLTISHLGL